MREREIVIRLKLPLMPRKRWLIGAAAVVTCFSAIAYAALVTFVSHTTLTAADLNANFSNLDGRVTPIEGRFTAGVLNVGNGGTGSSGPTQAGQFLRSSAAGAWSYSTGISGNDISGIFQLESNNALSANSTTNTSFVDMPGTAITFSAPVAKKYVVHADVSFFNNGGGLNGTLFRLVVNGSVGPTIWVNAPGGLVRVTTHLMHAADCAAGSNTIKIQWAVATGQTINTDTNDFANYIVTGG
jgi:hypothetical protein